MFGYKTYQKLKVINRFNYILLVFFKAGFGAFIYHFGFKKHIPWFHRLLGKRRQETVSRLPLRFRLALESLGPVFVKFGQILSTRSDLLPPEYIAELEKLQAHVPPFSFFEAKTIIEDEFGRPLHLVFSAFEKKPFASASLGQVYRATLVTGKKVAVKIQRPGAKKQIQLDTEVLLMVASFAERHIDGARQYNPMEVVQEFRRWTLNELDFHKEGVNCEIFANFFKDNPSIYSPKVYWDYTRASVLTLEYIDGEPLSRVIARKTLMRVDRRKVVQLIADAFIRQYFEFGFFHADPHPGNIFILPGNKVMFLDFGMVGFLDSRLTGLAAAIFLALMQRDVEKIVALALQMEGDYDDNSENRDARSVVRVNAFRKALSELLMQWSDLAKPGEFTKLFYNLMNVAVKNGVSVPVDLVMLSKSIMTLDVVVRQLDGDLRIEEWEGPLVEKIISSRFKTGKLKARAQSAALVIDEIIKNLPDRAAGIIANLEKGKFGMEVNANQLLDYERLLNANSKANAYGTLLAAIVIAFALIYQSSNRAVLLGWTVPQIGLYAAIILIILFFISNRSRTV